MSDVAATNYGCGCGMEGRNGSGCSSIIWLLLLLSCCGCGNGMGFGGDGGNDCCLLILLLLFCGGCGGSFFNTASNGCGCGGCNSGC